MTLNLSQFIPPEQLKLTQDFISGEDGQFYKDTLTKIQNIVDTMPKTYETDGQGYNATAYLHYFLGSADIYITERDMEEDQLQAFGWVCFGGGRDEGELGYVNLQEVFDTVVNGCFRFELDYYFEPKPLHQALDEKYGK